MFPLLLAVCTWNYVTRRRKNHLWSILAWFCEFYLIVLFLYILQQMGIQNPNKTKLVFFVIFINQMFGSSQKSVKQKPLKDSNFPSVYVYVYKCMYVLICLQASGGRCAKTMRSSYWLCEIKNKRCGCCILTTKNVTHTNYYNILIKSTLFFNWSIYINFDSCYLSIISLSLTHTQFFTKTSFIEDP